MIYLADHTDSNTPTQLGEVATNQNLSMRYLEQLVMPLKSAGLLRSVHGKHGGYFLTRRPENISINEIVEASIGPIRLLDCLNPDVECSFSKHCGSHDLWSKINGAITDILSEHTLADLSEKGMRQIAAKAARKGRALQQRSC